ncbi:hypothetical protein T01_13337 [Trichinella spiralis]|uniref:Uncharacterized protein n=1 Tax=Trichinella spiralis TaxID=6334 RepID=A0A0V1BE05_TRISP|nr:hypothetical protein T01_13337 [Trichinella spiralis]
MKCTYLGMVETIAVDFLILSNLWLTRKPIQFLFLCFHCSQRVASYYEPVRRVSFDASHPVAPSQAACQSCNHFCETLSSTFDKYMHNLDNPCSRGDSNAQ